MDTQERFEDAMHRLAILVPYNVKIPMISEPLKPRGGLSRSLRNGRF
jgi:hypothetical protein